MEKTFFTKLIYEHKTVEDNSPNRITVEKPVWDADANEMLEMFHTIMIGATFTEASFQGALIDYLNNHGYNVDTLD